MDKPWQVIGELERHSSRLNKEAIILAQAQAQNQEFFQGCRLALDSMVTFGLKQISEKTDADGAGLDWPDFIRALDDLSSRNITGHAARDLVIQLMGQSTKQAWNGWYRRILIKDLRCGVSEKTINNVVGKKYPDFAVPVFTCQLAHDSTNHESKVCGKKLIEVKLDGVRVITVIYPNGQVNQFSRNGKELLNFGHIRDQLQKISGGLTTPMVLDGEVMSNSFQDLMRQVHRKSDVSAGDAVLYVFDCMPLADFKKGKFGETQTTRSAWLKQWYENHAYALPNVRRLDQALVDLDTEQGQKLFRMYNKSAVENGYEGIMIKDPRAFYECKRSVAWLKLKPFIEVSLAVVGVEEGTGKNQGSLGALICEGQDDGKQITVNVGTGFTDADRDSFWAGQSSLLGQVVEVRADAVTQNQDGSYSLRFPRFLKFRGFQPGEKI